MRGVCMQAFKLVPPTTFELSVVRLTFFLLGMAHVMGEECVTLQTDWAVLSSLVGSMGFSIICEWCACVSIIKKQ